MDYILEFTSTKVHQKTKIIISNFRTSKETLGDRGANNQVRISGPVSSQIETQGMMVQTFEWAMMAIVIPLDWAT